MRMIMIRHKVADFEKWRPFFDADTERQEGAGLTNPRVFRSAEDRNDVFILFDARDFDEARAMAESPDLRDVMRKAGVVDQPTAYFLESA